MTEERPIAYGIKDPITGAITTDVRECAVTGRRITLGDISARIAGTPYFYRLSSRVRNFTDEQRQELEANILAQAGYQKPVEEAPAVVEVSGRRKIKGDDTPTSDTGSSQE